MATPLTLEAGRERSLVLVERNLLGRLHELLSGFAPSHIALVTDRNVHRLHGAGVLRQLKTVSAQVLPVVIRPGERSKNSRNLMHICRKMAVAGMDRQSMVVALGGGVVTDLAGFAAGIYKRGIDCVALPTSLLGQVDAAIGGKTGINLPAGKNLAGTFHHPRLVLADPTVLTTLPDVEWRNGFGEVLKYGLLGDQKLFENLRHRPWESVRDDCGATEHLVARCAAIKVAICRRDPWDEGERMHLNLGHTIGHALEAAAGFENLRHGEAVALGLVAEADLAARLGLADDALPGMVRDACARLGLRHTPPPMDLALIRTFLWSDKKRTSRALRFALPRAVGRVEMVNVKQMDIVMAAIKALMGR